MKKTILILALLVVSIFSSLAAPVISDDLFRGSYPELPQLTTTPTNWIEDSFSPGDTTGTADVNHASVVYFMFRDSALTGTDTFWIGVQVTLNNGIIIKGAVTVHNMATTTITTYITFPIVPGNNSTAIYAFNPTSVGGTKFTGTLFVARTNVNDNVTPYLPVTRWAYTYE